MKSILEYETVDYDRENKMLVIIDQTKLPNDIELISMRAAQDIWDAIYELKVRGAPAIGIAAAIGLAVLAEQIEADETSVFLKGLLSMKDFLNSARPTAVNLSWALNRMVEVCRSHMDCTVEEIKRMLLDEALAMKREDIEICRQIGEHGLTLVRHGDGILTHCNAGQLATCKYGTATAPVYLGHERGYVFRLYVDETRPLLQGARLTAYELHSAGIDVTLLCDNMSASLMQQGLVQAVLVGCDRVAANGDTANKIGTSVLAAVAKQYHVPFYVCAPSSTIDFDTPTGKEIVIEQRKPEEVSHMWYQKPMTAEGVKIYNPAFDVTSHELITGFITEKGIIKTPKELL